MRAFIVILSLTTCGYAFERESNCKAGWLRFEDKCFKIFTKKKDSIREMNFTDAVNFCQKQGPDSMLATIHSSSEQDLITSKLSEAGALGSTLIGMKIPNKGDKFEWLDGTDFNYENWDNNEPNNLNKFEKCVEIRIYGESLGRWNDIFCDAPREFICQSKLSQSHYSMFVEKKSWSEAEKACQADGSHLASILDGFEMATLRERLKEKPDDYWIGLRATLTQLESFKDKLRHYLSWSDHRPVYYLEWNDNEPMYSSRNETQCVYLKSNLRWSVADCQERFPFICVKHLQPYEKKERVEGFCRNSGEWSRNIIEVGGANCYVIGSDLFGEADFYDARAKCQQLGGDLAHFETRDEMKLLRPYFRGAGDETMFWVGISANSRDGVFQTSTGKFISKDMWFYGEANLLNEEKCVAVHGQSARLLTASCTSRHNFICQIRKSATKDEIKGCQVNEFKCKNLRCIPQRKLCNSFNDCQDNSDELQDVCNERRVCPESWFLCGSSGKCIPSKSVCDGVDNCGNGKDEEGCDITPCESDKFRCANQKCLPLYYRCDGDNDCGDFSDERNCAQMGCSDDKWKCNNGKCIINDYRCDGDNDCGDESDEKDCVFWPCVGDRWKCDNGKCVKTNVRCDGRNDCGDSSDESSCAPRECAAGMWKCNNRVKCVSENVRCNGVNDCGDNSDEKDCGDNSDEKDCVESDIEKCPAERWKCDDGNCIIEYYRCDGEIDCVDKSDEKNCANWKCAVDKWKCDNGICILKSLRCNGENNCNDNSDEKECDRWQCEDDKWKCGNGICISEYNRCDGRNDCIDQSDEKDCGLWQCLPGMYKCHNEKCVFQTSQCYRTP